MNWEYRVEPISFADIAVASKALGRDGWEAVAIIPQSGGQDSKWTVVVLKKVMTNKTWDPRWRTTPSRE
jgi:hypothetical protein